MKLDKIKFAMVVGFIQRQFAITISANELAELDHIIDVEVPDASNFRASVSDVDAMLRAICENRKIEAIKAYRAITGMGLKESKNAIEANWFRQSAVAKEHTLGDILAQAVRD